MKLVIIIGPGAIGKMTGNKALQNRAAKIIADRSAVEMGKAVAGASTAGIITGIWSSN